MDAAGPVLQDFERTRLQPMYQRVAAAIRQVDPHHILFIEPSMSTNLGIPTALQPVTDRQGHRDPHQAFAPHAYDMVTDTASVDLNSRDRIRFILDRHAETAKRLAMPMLIGEWGAFYLDSKAVEPAQIPHLGVRPVAAAATLTGVTSPNSQPAPYSRHLLGSDKLAATPHTP